MKIINRDNRAYSFILNKSKRVIVSGRKNIDKTNPTTLIMNGYAITEVEDKDWEAVIAKYGFSYPLSNGLIYADKSEKNTLAFAKEREKEKIKFAPLSDADIKTKALPKNMSMSNFVESI